MEEARVTSSVKDNGNIESLVRFTSIDTKKVFTIRLIGLPKGNYKKTNVSLFMNRVQIFTFDVDTDSLPVALEAMDGFLVGVGANRE